MTSWTTSATRLADVAGRLLSTESASDTPNTLVRGFFLPNMPPPPLQMQACPSHCVPHKQAILQQTKKTRKESQRFDQGLLQVERGRSFIGWNQRGTYQTNFLTSLT